MSAVVEIFTTYIYQPFFNILVGIYWLLGKVMDTPDMGVAVIIFAIVVRLILLPLDLSGQRSAKEREEIEDRLKAIKKEYAHDHIKRKMFEREVFKSSPGAVIAETINIVIQVIIILMLYRIFKTGLEGADLPLLYSFMPAIDLPINLLFLGKYDLSVTNSTLNLIQSLCIFAVEGLNHLFSEKPTTRREFLSLVVIFPVVAYLIFMFLPAGKKVFIITSLSFSIVLLLVKQLIFWYHEIIRKLTQPVVKPVEVIPSEPKVTN
jgi:membrane protein insertase Oxa1/YidC/SpoIIIJ